MDNFFIRQIIVKGDGGFILAAEDYTSENRGINNFNRYDYLYNPYSLSSGGYYYNPYTGYYRPLNSYRNQSTRYYFDNILVLSMSKTGQLEWSRVLHKSQFDDEEENFMSFSTMISGSEIHFLFNNDRRYQVVTNQGISASGMVNRYPTLKTDKKVTSLCQVWVNKPEPAKLSYLVVIETIYALPGSIFNEYFSAGHDDKQFSPGNNNCSFLPDKIIFHLQSFIGDANI
ncbi:MAG: hypothetical protein IPL84_03355 [Chitinophagaceae bacterium]|nr:hypothetical protein [Chitinophagaceae bacterium]